MTIQRMSSPSITSKEHILKQSQIFSEMSTSLRERLKKCGRYHPGTPLNERPANATASASNIQGIAVTGTEEEGSSTETQADEKCSLSKSNIQTPNRRTSESFNGKRALDNTGFIKRRRLHCNDKPDHEDEATQSSSVSCSKLESEQKQGTLLQQNENQPILNVAIDPDNEQNYKKPDADVYLYPAKEGGDLLTGGSSQNDNYASLSDQRRTLEMELKEKEEQLRKLKMVKMYREKNNLTELQSLIDKWRGVSQEALVDLQAFHPPPKPTLAQLINHLKIDHELLHYDADEEDFC